MRFLIPHLITAAILYFITAKMQLDSGLEAKDKNGNHVVRLPKVCFWVGFVGVVFWVGMITLMAVFPNKTASWWVYALFYLFVIGSFCLMYVEIAWKITFSNSNQTDGFVFRSILFRTVSVRYNECFFRFEKDVLIVYTGEQKKIRIPKDARGYDSFALMIRQKAKGQQN